VPAVLIFICETKKVRTDCGIREDVTRRGWIWGKKIASLTLLLSYLRHINKCWTAFWHPTERPFFLNHLFFSFFPPSFPFFSITFTTLFLHLLPNHRQRRFVLTTRLLAQLHTLTHFNYSPIFYRAWLWTANITSSRTSYPFFTNWPIHNRN
jgi:hypothetical protein